MGAIGGLLGTSGGINGTGIAGPQAAPITPGTNAGQLATAYTGNQNALQSQQDLLTALQGQNGIANQTQNYNQLQGVVNGTGPNPAQAQLAQATGANTANQAALMAGQRGASSNVGLMARQAAQQGGANQQAAAGQAATLQAQQSLNALGQAGAMANTQAGQQIGATTANTQAQQSEQNILQGANTAANQANVAMQSNINSANAGLAQTTMQGQQGLVGGVMNAGGAGAQMLAGPSAAAAWGGEIQKFANGTPQAPVSQPGGATYVGNMYAPGDNSNSVTGQGMNTAGPSSSFGQFLKGQAGAGAQVQQANNPLAQQTFNPQNGSQALQQGMGNLGKGITSMFKSNAPAAGTPVPAAPQPGDMTAQQQNMTGVQGGGAAGGVQFGHGGNVGSKLKSGGGVPGSAKVNGNSYSNDTVKALLSPGEVVIPRSVMQSGNPVDGAARFVAAVMAKKKAGGK